MTNDILSKIVDYQILRSDWMRDVGFFSGKMGIVTALYFYAACNRDEVLNDYAWELYQQVLDGVNSNMSLGLNTGLAGIGYATSLLRKSGVIECSLNDVLSEVDQKIMERDPRRLSDMSVKSGTSGLLMYIDLRQSIEPITTFDSLFITELKNAIKDETVDLKKDIIDILTVPSFDMADYLEKPLNIDGGSAYFLLKASLT